jgi:sugar phosphate isomerase/epimerase
MIGPCYVSTGCFRTRSLDDIVFLALQHGLCGIELSSGLVPFDLDAVLPRLEPLAPCIVHNYFPPPAKPFVLNLAAADEATRQESLALCRRAIDHSAAFGAPFYSVHSGFVATLNPEQLGRPEAQAEIARDVDDAAYERAFDRCCESAAYLGAHARAAGVRLLFENNVLAGNPHSRHLLMVRYEEFERFFAAVNDPTLGVLVDVGHLRVSARTCGFSESEFCLRLAHRIEAFHLSENDGYADQNLPVRPDSWFWPVVRQFPDAVCVLEAYGLSEMHLIEQLDLIAGQLAPERSLAYETNPR